MKLNLGKSGSAGIIVAVVGAVMLVISFLSAYDVYQKNYGAAQAGLNSGATDFVASLNSLLQAAIVVMFIGIMGWVGSIFVSKAVEFFKVEKGIGLVTFKVDNGSGLITGTEIGGKGQIGVLDASKPEVK